MLEAWATAQAQQELAQPALAQAGEATQRLWFAPAQDTEGFDEDDEGTGAGTMDGRGVYEETDDAPHRHDVEGESGEDEDDRWNQV